MGSTKHLKDETSLKRKAIIFPEGDKVEKPDSELEAGGRWLVPCVLAPPAGNL